MKRTGPPQLRRVGGPTVPSGVGGEADRCGELAKDSWDNAAQAAMDKDWESFATLLTDLLEVEA